VHPTYTHSHIPNEEAAGVCGVGGALCLFWSPPPPRRELRQSDGAAPSRGLVVVVATSSGAPWVIEGRCFLGMSTAGSGAGGQKRWDRSPEHIAEAAATCC